MKTTGSNSGHDLTTEVFLILRRAFFLDSTEPIPFQLRDKRNTQDDPLDEYIAELLQTHLTTARCAKASGPLTTPDLVVFRPDQCQEATRSQLRDDLASIVAIEVKKLERTAQGSVARASGMDYNTTPPCGTVRVYDRAGAPLDIRGFYLFVCQEPVPGEPGTFRLSALCLCDGNLLNADFDYYLSIVGQRTKEIGLGTYGDGANRSRPMLIFSNPLGAALFDKRVTLIHPSTQLQSLESSLALAHIVERTEVSGNVRTFYAYCHRTDAKIGEPIETLRDPFPTPQREVQTQRRGQFRLDLLVER